MSGTDRVRPSRIKKARGAAVSRSTPLYVGRKPNSVPARLLKARRRWSFISRRSPVPLAARCLATRVRPIPGTGGDCSPPGRQPGVPVWPCTAWGLSCPGGCPPGGGLLPRLFTLTARPVQAPRGGMFSVTLSIDRDFRPGPPRLFPRHAALWCSDFPLPPRRERPSTRWQGSRSARCAQGEKTGPTRRAGLATQCCSLAGGKFYRGSVALQMRPGALPVVQESYLQAKARAPLS
jgi:hypothetical protein